MPVPQEQRVTLNDFSGGLNLRDDISQIQDNEMSTLQNWDVTEAGELVKRPGFELRSSIGSPAGQLKIIGNLRGRNFWQILAANDTNFYYSNDGAATWTSITTTAVDGLPVGKIWYGCQYDMIFYMVRIDDVMLQWDGTTLTRIANSPSGTFCGTYRDRMWVLNSFGTAAITSNASWLYYSDVSGTGPSAAPGFPGDVWHNDINFIQVSPGDGDVLTGLGVLQDGFFLFKSKSVYRLALATSPLDWNLRVVSLDYGCVSGYTIREVEGALFFLGQRALYKTDGVTFSELSSPIRPAFDNHYPAQDPDWHLLNRDAGAFFENRYFLSLVCDVAGIANSKYSLYVFNVKTQTWSEYVIAPAEAVRFRVSTMLAVDDPTLSDKSVRGLYIGENRTTGNIWRWGHDQHMNLWQDNFSYYECIMTTKEFDFGDPVSAKRSRWTLWEGNCNGLDGTTELHQTVSVGIDQGIPQGIYYPVKNTAGFRNVQTAPGPGFFRVWKCSVINKNDLTKCVLLSLTFHYTRTDKRLGGQ